MHTIPHSHPIRVHGRVSLVVVVLLAALVSLTWPTGASGAPVAPVPVGVWPLPPRPTVVRAFDPPDLPFGSGHRGVDLLGAPGQRVVAALAGRVTFAGPLAGRQVGTVSLDGIEDRDIKPTREIDDSSDGRDDRRKGRRRAAR